MMHGPCIIEDEQRESINNCILKIKQKNLSVQDTAF
jgi:hypothetical protein